MLGRAFIQTHCSCALNPHPVDTDGKCSRLQETTAIRIGLSGNIPPSTIWEMSALFAFFLRFEHSGREQSGTGPLG